MNKKYKIVIDTNILRLDKKNQNFSEIIDLNILSLIKDFLSSYNIKNDVEICVPEMVLNERTCQVLEEIEKSKEKIKIELKTLEDFGLAPNKVDEGFNYEEKITQKIESFVEKDLFKKIKIPDIEAKYLIERVYQRKPPFSEEDRGFKDTIIWLSILDDAKNNSDRNYIFFTDDGHFKNEKLNTEFKGCSDKNFSTVSEILDLKKKFDLEYDLKLQLEETSQNINKAIRGWTFVELQEKLNSDKSKYFIRDLYVNKRFSIEEFFIDQSSLKLYGIENIEDIGKDYKVVLNIPAMAKLGSPEVFLSASTNNFNFNLDPYFASTSGTYSTATSFTTSAYTNYNGVNLFDPTASSYIINPISLSYETGSLIKISFQIEINIQKDFKKISVEKIIPIDPVEF